MGDIRLISTDLDGTVVGHSANFQIYEEFRDRITEYRSKYNAMWAICTGRNFSSTRRFLRPMQALGITPDYIIVAHAYIYEQTQCGYIPHIGWNYRMRKIFRKNKRDLQNRIDKWYSQITCTSIGVVTVYKTKNRLRMRMKTEEAAESAERMMIKDSAAYPYLRIVRSGREIDVFQLPFSKGLAVSELAGHLIIDRSEILTIGNGRNDISMLDNRVASCCGCPANAVSEVQYLVHTNKGHLATRPELEGVIEILDAYLNSNVNSALPVGWIMEEAKISGSISTDSSSLPHTEGLRRAVLFTLVFITVLLVVAWFGVIPFSYYILKPFYLGVKAIEKLVSLFI